MRRALNHGGLHKFRCDAARYRIASLANLRSQPVRFVLRVLFWTALSALATWIVWWEMMHQPRQPPF